MGKAVHTDEENPAVIFTCEICIEPTPYAEKRFRNGAGGCSHPFCSNCVAKYIRAKLESGNAGGGRIECPTLDLRACEPLVDPSLFTCEDVEGKSSDVAFRRLAEARKWTRCRPFVSRVQDWLC